MFTHLWRKKVKDMAEMRYTQAINQALCDSMERDEAVIVLGEDVGAAGGSFKATRDLYKNFGAQRVRDTPISEARIVSVAVGAAMTGLMSVVDIMFILFFALAMDPIVDIAAQAQFM